MAIVESTLSVEQILENIRQLSDQEQRRLAAVVLSDRNLEAFVEELDDHLTCESASLEGEPEALDPSAGNTICSNSQEPKGSSMIFAKATLPISSQF